MASYAQCPFYEKEVRNTLYCEGTNVHFPSDDDRGMWMKMHCYSHKHRMCKFYVELMEKYDSDN